MPSPPDALGPAPSSPIIAELPGISKVESYRTRKQVLDKHPMVAEHAREAIRRAAMYGGWQAQAKQAADP